jgi:hypothetical protein
MGLGFQKSDIQGRPGLFRRLAHLVLLAPWDTAARFAVVV